MKKLFFIVLGFVSVLTGVGQNNKNHFEVNFGLQNLQNKSVFTTQPQSDCANGAFSLKNIKEKSLNLPTFSILRYHGTQVKNLSAIFGVGINQKGFVETASRIYYESSLSVQNYSTEHIMTYASLQVGFNYTLLTRNRFEISIVQMLFLETKLNNGSVENSEFETVAYSSATFLKIFVPTSDNSGLSIKPFFQTALTNYNKDRTDFNGNLLENNYRPFGYGLSLGFSF